MPSMHQLHVVPTLTFAKLNGNRWRVSPIVLLWWLESHLCALRRLHLCLPFNRQSDQGNGLNWKTCTWVRLKSHPVHTQLLFDWTFFSDYCSSENNGIDWYAQQIPFRLFPPGIPFISVISLFFLLLVLKDLKEYTKKFIYIGSLLFELQIQPGAKSSLIPEAMAWPVTVSWTTVELPTVPTAMTTR